MPDVDLVPREIPALVGAADTVEEVEDAIVVLDQRMVLGVEIGGLGKDPALEAGLEGGCHIRREERERTHADSSQEDKRGPLREAGGDGGEAWDAVQVAHVVFPFPD
jgi:hypothetical protein